MSEPTSPLAGPSRGFAGRPRGLAGMCACPYRLQGLADSTHFFQCVSMCLRAHGKQWLMCTDLTAVVADQVGLVIIYFWKWLTYGHWFIAVLSWLCALISWVFAVWLCTHACLHECSWITRFCNVCICSDFFCFSFCGRTNSGSTTHSYYHTQQSQGFSSNYFSFLFLIILINLP